ncbi:hypothetical protein [Streptomyces tubercidicus]
MIATVSAVVVTVVAGWAGQVGNALYEAAFGGEEPTQPTVTVSSIDDPFCNIWLLRETPELTQQKIKSELHGVNDLTRKKIPDGLRRAKESSGSLLPTGTGVEVTIEGNKEKVVVLEGLEPNIVKKSKMGDLMGVGDQCGGGFPARFFAADLDAPKPEFHLSTVDDNGEKISKPIDFPFKVSATEPEKFVLSGKTKSVVEWTATLHWVADGKEGETEISDNGKPFVSYPETQVKYFFNTTTRKLETLP